MGVGRAPRGGSVDAESEARALEALQFGKPLLGVRDAADTAAGAPHGTPSRRRKKKKHVVIVRTEKYPYIVEEAQRRGWRLRADGKVFLEKVISSRADMIWCDGTPVARLFKEMSNAQRVNKLPGMAHLAQKSILSRLLNTHYRVFPDAYAFSPRSWVLPDQRTAAEEDVTAAAMAPRADAAGGAGSGPIYIFKPNAGSQGAGVVLTREMRDVPRSVPGVLQEYVAEPYLIDGYKFDLRLYVLVTSLEPLRVHLYREGMARFCTQKYSKPNWQNMSNACMHLTNYAINKQNENFEVGGEGSGFDEGFKRSLASVLEHVRRAGGCVDTLWRQIGDLVGNTMLAMRPTLLNVYERHFGTRRNSFGCYQLIGFDILLDAQLKPWLIEINNNPSMAAETDFDMQLKHGMLRRTWDAVAYAPSVDLVGQDDVLAEHRDWSPAKARREAWRRNTAAIIAHEDTHLDGFDTLFPLPTTAPAAAPADVAGDEGGSGAGAGSEGTAAEQRARLSVFASNLLRERFLRYCVQRNNVQYLDGVKFARLVRDLGVVRPRGLTTADCDLIFVSVMATTAAISKNHVRSNMKARMQFNDLCNAFVRIAALRYPSLPTSEQQVQRLMNSLTAPPQPASRSGGKTPKRSKRAAKGPREKTL